MGSRQQRGDFWGSVFGVSTPAPCFADVDEFDDRSFGLGFNRKFTKQTLLLCTGHHHIVRALHGLHKGTRFTTAQRGVQRQVFRQALAQCLRV